MSTPNSFDQPPGSPANAPGSDVVRIVDAGSELPPSTSPPVTPAQPTGLLRELEKIFLYLDRLIGRFLPESLNPLLHTGSIAVATFLVAAVTGILLLFWYSPSVHHAFDSVQAMSDSPWGSGLVRSLHRYSSDACVFFAVLHLLRLFFQKRFVGPRWLAWVTGSASMGLLWFIGWTGYWLVWDLRAQSIAVGTAKLLDVLPIFADPLGRSFLTDEGVNSLLFFVVFFFHMLVPLAMGVVLWIHITRLARARFLTTRPMSIWVGATLLLLSIAYPATNASRASMTLLPQPLTMDWWYLLPLPVIDRLAGGPAWAVAIVGGLVFFSVPWWLARRRIEPASVVESRCNECTKCYQDCPFEAIQMIPRTDGNDKYQSQASVILSKCVECGICAGSCDTAGIGIDSFSTIAQRRRIESWLKEAEAAGEETWIAFSCAESAGAGLTVDPETGRCNELEGYRVLQMPCIGWVHPLMIERALRNGAKSVLMVSCGPAQCLYREGAAWTEQRMAGEREPVLRTDKVAPDQLRLVSLDRTRTSALIDEARRVREDQSSQASPSHSPVKTWLAAAALAIVFGGATGLVSDFVYAAPTLPGSELVVSLKHPGAISENCRDLSEEELAALPAHMRKPRVCERSRSPVRLRVDVDGVRVVEETLAPAGIWKDGNSVTVQRLGIDPGEHEITVAIGESADLDEWSLTDSRTLEFTTEARRVVIFDRMTGFTWH